jgi:uncharacterized protein YerC
MTNVKHTLTPKDKARLTQQLAGMFTANKDKNIALFNSLYTPAEQILSIKRLATIVMLHEGYTTYRVAQALDMSHATVLRHQRRLKRGEYDVIVSFISKKQFDRDTFWRVLETLLRAGLPPMAGPGRWEKIAPAAVRKSRGPRCGN